MSVRSRRKKRIIRYSIIGFAIAAVTAVCIFFLVRFTIGIFGEKPVNGPAEVSSTPRPTPTPEPWDPNGVPQINHIIATSEILTVSYERVKGVGCYEINYRSEEGDWQQVTTKETKYFLPINSGFTYHVRVRSVSPTGEFGPLSDEGIVSAEAVPPVVRVDAKNDRSITFSWPYTREGANYVFYFRAAGDTEWHQMALNEPKVSIGGMIKGKQYEVMVSALKEDFATLSSEPLTVSPEGSDYGDPFKNVYAFLKVGKETRSVSYTAEDGLLGIPCWAQMKTSLYTDVGLNTVDCDVPGGTPMTVSADASGAYICQRLNNKFSVHVSMTINGEDKEGWILANALLMDLAKIFPAANKYSIQYNRTNAYASLFTCGGNAQEVDVKSDEETRYDPLKVKDGKASLEATGYNEIKDVTGKVLPNYGSKDQMPAVFDVALCLLTAQRNALAQGYCLLIYEAYRPNATSKKVYSAMTGNAYFKEEIENETTKKKLTLANGFLDKNYTEAYFIANNSRHNQGIALDLTIMKYDSLEKLGEEVPMQTKMHTLDYRCDMTYNTKEAKTLYSIMTAGTRLVPLVAKQEWWHFELGKDIADFPCIKDYVFANYKL